MLRIQVNKRDAVPSYRSLGETSSITATLSEEKVALSGFGIGGMSVGDRIRFVRKDCKGNVIFNDTTTIANISSNTIILNPLPDIELDGAETKLGIKKVPNGTLFNALEIRGKHCYIDNPAGCDIDVKENVVGNYTDYDKNKRRCEGDYVLYEGCFLYKATGVTSDNKYAFSANGVKNAKVKIKMLNDTVYKQYIGRHGDNWDARNANGFIWLTNCVVPVNGDGTNDINSLIWEGSVATGPIGMAMPNENGVYENGATYFACENERYYRISGSTVTFEPNVEVFFEENCIKVSGVLEENFEINLFQRNAIEKKFFFEKNKTIDFEKQIFYPVYGNSLKDMSSITYNVYFRERTGVKQPTDDASLAAYEEGIKKWKIKEEGKWNVSTTSNSPDGDLVGYVGFTDDDIYYQKKKIGMSFLRLSLYDTKDRLTQSLLGYSTMFLDSTALYKKYVLKKNSAAAAGQENKYIVFRTDEPQLGINFSCANKYNSDRSSEGFYLYLFPSLLETQPKDDDWSIIYMKAEFNNAKYGKTVPFIYVESGMPRENYVVIDPDDNEKTYIDMNSLFNDMYIEIKIKYDEATKRYIWRFDGYDSADTVINLFEPKING